MQLTARRQPLTYEFPFVVSSFSKTTTTTVIIQLSYTSNNRTYTGIGEAVPVELYHTSPEDVLDFYKELCDARVLESLTPFDIQLLHERLNDYPGHYAAKAALDMAFYDLQGKLLDLPLWKLWGLNPEKCPRSSYTIGLGTLDEVKRKTEIALRRGYDILKIKLGSQHDVKQLQAIRQLAPHCVIRVDANAAWSVQLAVDMCMFLATEHVEFVEEPLLLSSTPEEYLQLKAGSPLPLMADERCHTS